MSAPYSAEDVRNILETFVGEFLVDVPAIGVQEDDAAHTRNLIFTEAAIVGSVFLASDEWIEEVANFANANAES